jgi:hypothetical protein
VSEDNGDTFKRFSEVPVLDRRDSANFFNAIHSVIYEDGVYKCWLGAGSSWSYINGQPYPSYNVKYIESHDGISFGSVVKDAITYESPKEYRIGRPRVYKVKEGYIMIYTKGDLEANYTMGLAHSLNGIEWTRTDFKMNFHPSDSGWDDKWVSYGALFTINADTYMVYNGNSMGKEGFGIAKLIEGYDK